MRALRRGHIRIDDTGAPTYRWCTHIPLPLPLLLLFFLPPLCCCGCEHRDDACQSWCATRHRIWSRWVRVVSLRPHTRSACVYTHTLSCTLPCLLSVALLLLSSPCGLRSQW